MERIKAQLDAAKEREEMTERQPDSPAFCWATELAMTQQPVTLSVTEAREVSAEMQLLHSENANLRTGYDAALMYEELRSAIDDGHESMTHSDALAEISAIRAENANLRTGYAAARLEIESLQARIKTMAEEHADELMVAHLDGRMRAAQPAPQQEAVAWLNPWRADQVTTDYDAYGEHGIPLVYQQPAPATQQASQADSVTAPAAGAVAHTLSDAQIEAMPVWRNFVGLWPESRREIVDAVVDLLAAAPSPPAQAADSVLEDAAPTWRCQHCIDRHDGIYGSWAAPCPYHDDDGKLRIDAARAAQEDNR